MTKLHLAMKGIQVKALDPYGWISPDYRPSLLYRDAMTPIGVH
jgi:hypothetical protein